MRSDFSKKTIPKYTIILILVTCCLSWYRYHIYVLCVFVPFILDIKFVGRTSRGHTGGRSHRISHTPSFCGACKVTGFLIHLLSAVHALIFLARRIQPFLSLVDREVEFCVLTI